jgi:hypothetical protein
VVIPARTIPESWKMKHSYANGWDTLFISQSVEAESSTLAQPSRQKDYYPYSIPGYVPPNYPIRHRTMAVLAYGPGDANSISYSVWAGDSGMPQFIAIADELLWYGFVGAGGVGPNGYPVSHGGGLLSWETLVNKMILDSDEDAISRGLGDISEPTGYTVVIANDILDKL